MEVFKYKQPIKFIEKSKISISISISLIIISFILLFTKGLNYGVDFVGGTIIQVKYNKEAPIQDIRNILNNDVNFKGTKITEFGSKEEIIIRLNNSSKNITKDIGDVIRQKLKNTGEYEIRRIDMIGPKVGKELKMKGITSMFLAILGILIYVSFRFEWKFAISSIIALIHDISIIIGILVITQININLDILAALLTILGYSLNDTIIVFDRIRESIQKKTKYKLEEIMNYSITKTLGRTIITSVTTFLVVFTLFIYGGEILNGFSFTLLMGIIIGTYSSIFIASPSLKILKFNISDYQNNILIKEKSKNEREKMRKETEQGVL